MKRQRYIWCLIGAQVAAAAYAQSGVTISGVADASVRWVSNETRGSAYAMMSGGNSTSRIIIRGVEDLGGGLSAGFHLENGLLLNSGTTASATQFWDRRSTVSLASKSLGELRAGRDNVPSYASWGRFDPFSYVGAAGSTNLVSSAPQGPIRAAFGTSANTLVRSSNAVQWLLPLLWGGIEGGVMVSDADTTAVAPKVVGLRLGYVTKTFDVSAAHTQTETTLTTSGKFKDSVVGASYDLGMARVSGVVRRFAYAGARQTNLLLGLRVPFGAVGELKASWQRADLAGRVGNTVIDDNDPSQWGLGYVHNLSKRTALYATYAEIDNKGATTLVVPGGDTGMPAGGTSRGFEVGMRHTF